MRTLWIFPVAFCALYAPAFAQEPQQETQTFDPSERADEFGQVSSVAKPTLVFDPDRSIKISGEFVIDNWLLAAKEVIFEPGARLIFSEKARELRDEFFIVAEVIRVEGQQRPPVVTWAKPEVGPQGDRGQAQSGPHGTSAGDNGGNGTTGALGHPGTDGVAGPSLTIFATGLQGSGLVIDLGGSDGGQGGNGQKGGQGGNGAQGAPAQNAMRSAFGMRTAVGCAAGPGRGGNGGTGGRGGQGGPGGIGGRGGNLTIISIPDALPTLTQLIRVDLSSGQGGEGGPRGDGGERGIGGPEGPRTSWCGPANRPGANGQPGGEGPKGERGRASQAGDFYVGSLSREKFSELFGF